MISNPIKNNKGQAMLLASLLIGTSVLIFSSIAGYLMVERYRQSSTLVNSTKAILAADSGLECELYRYNFNVTGTPTPRSNVQCSTGSPASTLIFDDDKTSVETQVEYDASNTPLSIKSVGTNIYSNRAFLLHLR